MHVAVLGQERLAWRPDSYHEWILPRDLIALSSPSLADSSASDRWARCPLFRMPAGLSTEVLSVDDDDSALLTDPESLSQARFLDDRRLQVALGNDNPFFDFRRPGDWGGIGYYRLQSQVLCVDSNAACLGLGFHAVTPAGLDVGGLGHGPTVMCPHLAWFYEIGHGTAIQGFVAKSFYAHSNWSDTPGRSIRYGIAVQRPLPGLDADPAPRAHFFLEALGRNRFDGESTDGSSANFELLPGVHWRLCENNWISSGVLMPLEGFNPGRFLWQLTCSWRF